MDYKWHIDIQHQLHVQPPYHLLMTLLATEEGYQVEIDKLRAGNFIELVAAIATPNMNRKGQATLEKVYVLQFSLTDGSRFWLRREDDTVTDDFWEPRHAPKTVTLTGEYDAVNRVKHVSRLYDLKSWGLAEEMVGVPRVSAPLSVMLIAALIYAILVFSAPLALFIMLLLGRRIV